MGETVDRDIELVVGEYRRGGVSRRELATRLTAVTAAFAASATAVAQDQLPMVLPLGLPASGTTFVPSPVGAGADDYQTIQDAIDAAYAAGGGRVLIDGHLQTGQMLTLRTGVELAGSSREGASISAHPSFTDSNLLRTAPDTTSVRVIDLTLDSGGLCPSAVIRIGTGSSRIRIQGVRFTGWSLGTPEVIALALDAAPDPGGSNRVLQHIQVDDCEFEAVGDGVKIANGASDVSVSRSRFFQIYGRALWIRGSADYSSSRIQLVSNIITEFPFAPDLKNAIAIGALGDAYHDHLLVAQNAIVGNGDYFGAGGLGTADHYSLHCVRQSHVSGNVSIDCGDTAYSLSDSRELMVTGNLALNADIRGFSLRSTEQRCLRNQFIGNFAKNNGQNRGGQSAPPFVFSGFLLRDFGLGIRDTLLLGNHAYDTQGSNKTQNYALAIANPTVKKTLLNGNVFHANQNAVGSIYNKGQSTLEASYATVAQTPG